MKKIILCIVTLFSLIFLFITNVKAVVINVDNIAWEYPDKLQQQYNKGGVWIQSGTGSPFTFDTTNGQKSNTFTIASNSSVSWPMWFYISPAATEIPSTVIEHTLKNYYNIYPTIVFSICATSPQFKPIASSANNGKIYSVKAVQTDASCDFYINNEYYEASVYNIYIDVQWWIVNVYSELIYVDFYLGINNNSKDSVGNYTPLLFYFLPWAEAQYYSSYYSDSQAWSSLENARYTENIAEMIQEYYTINDATGDARWQKIVSSSVNTSPFASFFNNFTDSNPGSIASIVSSPLRLVNSLNRQCSPVSFNIFNKDITIPCGDSLFWGRNDVQTFRTLWNVLFGGLIIYRLLVKMFKSIEKMKDPTNDSVEVINL